MGLRVFAVLSGSMEPTYHTGSLIYVKSVDYKELQPGDVITFMLDEDTIATHRIVEVVPDETEPETLRFRTKGDANDAVDGGLVHYKNVVGTPVFTIPRLGYLADYIQHPPGMYVALSAGAVLILLVFLPDLFSKEEEKEGPQDRKKRRNAAAGRGRPPLPGRERDGNIRMWAMPKEAPYKNFFIMTRRKNHENKIQSSQFGVSRHVDRIRRDVRDVGVFDGYRRSQE